MTNYTIWADRGEGASTIYEVGKHLQQCAGGSVNVLGIGPNIGQSHGLSGGRGTTGVFMTNGVGLATPNDFEMGIGQGYYHYDHVIFVWPQYINNQYMSDENIKTHVIPGEWDWNRSSSYNVGGQTAVQWFPQAKHVDLVAGKSPQEIAQKICKGNYVGGSGNSSSSSSQSGNQSNVSPLLTGDMTFEELVGEICNGIDLLFLVKRSTVVVTDFESIFAEAKYLRDHHKEAVEGENVKLWQMEDESYELEINHHGYYNTVYVEYANGKVKESYEDLVQIFGEVAITYHDKGVDKTTAIMKAKSYLAAHLRDMEVFVKTTMLTEPDIEIGDIVTIENPQTMKDKNKISKGVDPEYLFVNGVNTSWEGQDFLQTDLECKFAPTSPNKLDVPTSGNGDGTNNTSGGGAGGKYNSCGVSEDGSKIMAIGKPSAVGESHYGYKLYKSVFVRKCPFCGSSELYWGYMWSGNFPCTKKFNNGSAGRLEGHIYCDGCDADFSCIDGKDHMSPPRATLTRISGPDPSSEEEAQQLKDGKMN